MDVTEGLKGQYADPTRLLDGDTSVDCCECYRTVPSGEGITCEDDVDERFHDDCQGAHLRVCPECAGAAEDSREQDHDCFDFDY